MHDIINDLFNARDIAHKLHLGSKSFSAHLALGELYEGLTDKLDELAEVFQGQFGLMNLTDTKGQASFSSSDPISFIQTLAVWVKNVKVYLTQESHILNIWDEIISLVFRAKYKLENLK